jgi:hypothetical protein
MIGQLIMKTNSLTSNKAAIETLAKRVDGFSRIVLALTN